MRFVVQVVTEAEITVADEAGVYRPHGAIGEGLCVLIGIHAADTEETVRRMTEKLLKLRIFKDEAGKTNLSLKDVNGALLLVSQFTLYADCRKGNRPSFTDAAPPGQAKALYDTVVAACRKQVSQVETGVFGADMRIRLTNDGPFTVLLDSTLLS